MEFTIDSNDKGAKVMLSGQLTYTDNQNFRKIVDYAEQHHPRMLTMNMSGMDFIDSTGLGMLLLLRDVCLGKNISLAFEGAHGQVQKIFTISKFDQLFST